LSGENLQIDSFQIEALHCADEFAVIQAALSSADGIVEISPNYVSRTLRVTYNADETTPSHLRRRLREIGFPPSPEASQSDESPPSTTSTKLRRTTALAGLLLVGGLLGYLVFPAEFWPACLAVASTILAGWPVVWAAWRAIRVRRIDMNVLMSIAATGALATAQWYEAATAMFLFGVAIWLESYSMGRAHRAVRSLVELTPPVAHRVANLTQDVLQEADSSDGQPDVEDVPVEQLLVGDRVLVKPGERIGVDGVVQSGRSAVNQAPITGESVPVDKNKGDWVYAGSLNGDGVLVIRNERPSNDTTLAHVRRLIEQAEAARSPTQRFVDRFAARYTPAVIALAVCLATVPPLLAALGSPWPAEANFLEWFHRGLVLLVIACPCALVISTPITIVCGLHRAARKGILIKGGEFLEAMAHPDCVAFDKTGTLTVGLPQVVDVVAESGCSPEDVLQLAASLEAGSAHPLATAIVDAAQRRGIVRSAADEVQSLPGLGVAGKVDGQPATVASPRHFEADGFEIPAEIAQALNAEEAATVALVARDQVVIGAIMLADQPRPTAKSTIESLRAQRVSRVSMLTGDHQAAAKSMAGQLGIDEVYSGLLPADKVLTVQKLTDETSNLVMVGDGVNDAPALAAARVGVALGSQSSDTALETADVVIMSPRLSRLPELIRLARTTRRRLIENISLAIFIKAVVLVLAALGHATMWMAVAADVGASLLVVFNGMRLLGPANTSLLEE